MLNSKKANQNVEDFDLELEDDLMLDLDDELDVDLDLDLDSEEEMDTKEIKLEDDLEDGLEEGEEEVDFDFDEDEDLELEEVKPIPKKETKPAPKKETKAEPKKEEVKPAPKKETKAEPKKEVKPIQKQEDSDDYEEKVSVPKKSSTQAKLELVLDKRGYAKLFDSVVKSKVDSYNEIQAERAKNKTTRIPTSKAISRADFASLVKAKMTSDIKYIKTFVKLLTGAGMDQHEAVSALLKDKISNKVFAEIYELVTDTMEDVLKAEAGVVLLAKSDIRATVFGKYEESEIRDISSLKKTDKYTHVRKSDFYKVSCKSPVLQSRIEGGTIDENGNFVPVEK